LDNSDGEPGWFELWPIMRFLEENDLEENVWYGFVSPKFPEKAGLTYSDIVRVIERNANCDVALFSYDWPSLAYWQNPWVSGDKWHPGLIDCMQDFLARKGSQVDLNEIWTDFDTSVFSNFIVARKQFWLEWQNFARAYYDYVEVGGPALLDNRPTQHRGTDGYCLKTFVQERLASWILLNSQYRIARPNYAFEVSLASFVGRDIESLWLRILLQGCHLTKKLARRTGINAFARLFVRFQRSARRSRNRLKLEALERGSLG
jgi:hypothetical protein